MRKTTLHTFHIPVLGLGYSIDTPVKVARFGISSVVSVVEDGLIEKMREYHCAQSDEEYIAITEKDDDYRARRITAYLDLLGRIVDRQMKELLVQPFTKDADIVKYFEMLPIDSPVRKHYEVMLISSEKETLQELLRKEIRPGAIDVNIMSKIDNLTHGSPEFSDALSALRGIANSQLHSSIVFSAGYNPRLYNYIENFPCFFPDTNGVLSKKVILKVSDFRSALIQGKLLAKKGIWISEFRIESGLNCGGHAFATEGMLLGPILEEFKQKRSELATELFELCNIANMVKGNPVFPQQPPLKITVQGGIGTSNEDLFLMEYYGVDGTGWGSPFLLVPEVTNVDDHTLQQLATAKKEDYFLSAASPLGIPFQNFRNSTAEEQRKERIAKGRPGSPCYKKFLASDTEFTTTPICTASRQYQDLKIKQLKEKNLPEAEFQVEFDHITSKDCLCEGLSVSVFLKDNIPVPHKMTAVTICPGPNLAYFSGVFSLREMVDHIYGRWNVLNSLPRPNMFVNEAQLYIDYLKKLIGKSVDTMNAKQSKYLNTFKTNLIEGIEYYKGLLPSFKRETMQYIEVLKQQLNAQQAMLSALQIA
ncbi:hypothetical protein SAMN05518672_10287 [Chitinophaga sp. CF118]|uniref:hypothetical protein n=1 Tax=Chitinophaga sp. CF118 TaxID=1884367 RepID=UPI0008E32B48|nr:hypothetical protein [Chitinophaga sp. CF118]SFD47338.1 hypothetical protein SAMN05518672_10287 [Chitinophaga sp. CF118]